MFWKDGLSKKSASKHDHFCNIWKDGISCFQKIWYFFFGRKMKEDDLYQRPLEIWYFLYICVGVTSMALSRKNTHKGDISGISEKRWYSSWKIWYFCWNTILIDTLEMAQYSATGDVLQEKVFLEISQNAQEKTCFRASFLIKLQV